MVTGNTQSVNRAFSLPQFEGASIDQIRQYIENLREQAFVVGSFTASSIPSMHKIVAELIWVDPREAGALYPTGKDDKAGGQPVWSLSNAVLKRLARAAAISWDSTQSGRQDDGRNPDIVRYQKVCRIRDLDGSMRTVQETYLLDLSAREGELVEAKKESWYWKRGEGQVQNLEKRVREAAEAGHPWGDKFVAKLRSEITVFPESDREPWAREQARLDMIQKRKFAEQLAATGAESRCILSALALQRGHYRLSDLSTKPFVVLKLVPNIDYEHDAQARMMLVAMHTGLIDAAYGHGRDLLGGSGLLAAPDSRQLTAPQALPAFDSAPMEAIAMDPDVPTIPAVEQAAVATEIYTQPVDPVADPAPTPTPVSPTPAPSGTASLPSDSDFATWPRGEQVALLREMLRAYPSLPKMDLDKSTAEGLVRYYGVCYRYIAVTEKK